MSFSESVVTLRRPAPDFVAPAVVNGEITDFKLSSLRGKYIVLFFYPKDFTYVCPTEICAFSDASDSFREIGCEVIGVSPDSEHTHLAFINTPRVSGGLGFMKIPLVSDFTKELSKKYGVYIPSGDDAGGAFRGLFIIDDKFNVRQITINDTPVGRSVDEALRLVQAFQFTDRHGEVCPVNWRPGDRAFAPDSDAAAEFFASGATKYSGADQLRDVIEVENAAEFDSSVKGSGHRVVLVEMMADWCGKCKALFPHFSRMSELNTDKVFLKVDVGKVPEVADRLNVTSVPRFLAIRDGKVIDSYNGTKVSGLEEFVNKF